MRRLIIAIVCCNAFFVGTVFSEETLTACGDSNYPPFTYIERQEGAEPKVGLEIRGVAPDILRIIFGELGIKVDAKYVGNWKRCQINVKQGNVDILMGAYMTEERKKYAAYTETPLAPDPQAVFVWKGREFKFEKWEDLKGKTVGMTIGFSSGKAFDGFLEKNTIVERVSDRLQNYLKLAMGRIDFEPNGLYAGLIKVKESGYEGRIVPLPTPINTEYLYMPVSKKSVYLKYLPRLDEGLKKLRADGTIDKLVTKYIEQYDINKSQ